MPSIHRITLFKVPDENDLPALVERLSTLKQDAKRDGKSYIGHVAVGQASSDQRNQGYTLCLETEFESLDDMKYYDEADEAHASLKSTFKGKVAPPPLVMYMSDYKAQ